MDIKDALGFGKIVPIEKLLEVVGNATGRVFKNYFVKKDINAKAYEIRTIAAARADELKVLSQAIQDNQNLAGDIQYSETGLTITSTLQNRIEISNDVKERVIARNEFQEIKKQNNIENITAIASEELSNEKTVTDEPLEDDWTTRFFKIAEDISSEEMQSIWGKILAGEIRQPKSFSLRTLELLQNLSKKEAQIFAKISNFAVSSGTSNFLIKGNGHLLKKHDISYVDISLMVESGLIQSGNSVQWTVNDSTQDRRDSNYVYGNTVVVLSRPPRIQRLSFDVYMFTTAGGELLKLTNVDESKSYLENFMKQIWTRETTVKYAKITSRDATDIYYEDMKIFEPT